MPKILYTRTDEAPALATQSFLPIVQAYTKTSGISIETKDISLAARIISAFRKFKISETQIGNILNVHFPNFTTIEDVFSKVCNFRGYDIPQHFLC